MTTRPRSYERIAPEVLAALGRMTVSFNALEVTIREFILAMMSRDSDAGMALTAQMSIRLLSRSLGGLFRTRFARRAAQLEELDRILGGANRVADQRNSLIHGYWVGGNAGPLLLRTTADGRGIRHTHRAVTAHEIDQLTADIEALGDDLFELHRASHS